MSDVPAVNKAMHDAVLLHGTAWRLRATGGVVINKEQDTAAFLLSQLSQCVQIVTVCNPMPPGGTKYVGCKRSA